MQQGCGYRLFVQQQDFHARRIAEHLVNVELQCSDGIHFLRCGGSVVEEEKRVAILLARPPRAEVACMEEKVTC